MKRLIHTENLRFAATIVMAFAILAPQVGLAQDGQTYRITDPDHDEDEDEVRKKAERIAAPCFNCGDTSSGSGGILSGGVGNWVDGDVDVNRCSRFSASTGGTYHWIDMNVDITNGAQNWIANGSSAQAYASAYCQAKPDPAGFAHHIEFGRSCTLTTGWGFQGAQQFLANYKGCYSKTSVAIPGGYVPLKYAKHKPAFSVQPYLGDASGTTSGTGAVEVIAPPASVRK